MKPIWNLALLFAFCCASNCHAQLENESEFGLSFVLSIGGVASELEMSGEQSGQLAGLWFQVQDEMRAEFTKYSNQLSNKLTAEKKKQLDSELAEGLKKIRNREQERIEKVLFAHQIDRLKQLRFQYSKRSSVGMEAIAKELGVTRDQVKQIKKVREDLRAKVNAAYSEVRDRSISQNELLEIIKNAKTQSQKDLLAVLTPAQMKELKKLEGEPFEFDVRIRRENEKKKKERNSQNKADGKKKPADNSKQSSGKGDGSKAGSGSKGDDSEADQVGMIWRAPKMA